MEHLKTTEWLEASMKFLSRPSCHVYMPLLSFVKIQRESCDPQYGYETFIKHHPSKGKWQVPPLWIQESNLHDLLRNNSQWPHHFAIILAWSNSSWTNAPGNSSAFDTAVNPSNSASATKISNLKLLSDAIKQGPLLPMIAQRSLLDTHQIKQSTQVAFMTTSDRK